MHVIKIEVGSWGFGVGWATFTLFPLFLGRELGGGLCAKLLQSCRILCDPVTAAHQAPLSIGVYRQEYWRGLP